MLRKASFLSLWLMLSACAQTFEQTEPALDSKPYIVSSTEDRIVLSLPDQMDAKLSNEYHDYVERFVTYYRDMPKAVFYVSYIKSADDQKIDADNMLPSYRPTVEKQLTEVTDVLDKLSVPYHRITEIDEGKPQKETPKKDPKEVIVDNKIDSNKKIAVAVIVKQYDVSVAGCLDMSQWRSDAIHPTMTSTQIGCSVRTNAFAQIKNPQNTVIGQQMDKQYNTMPFVKLQQDVNDRKFEPKELKDTSFSSGGK